MSDERLVSASYAVRDMLLRNIGNRLTEELIDGICSGFARRAVEIADGPDRALNPADFEHSVYHGYVISVDRLRDCLGDIQKMAEQHWNEMEAHRHDQGLNPDYEYAIGQERAGGYVLFTVRHADTIVGHLGMYVSKSLHTGATVANEDTLYIVPEHRRGRLAFRIIEYAEEVLRSLGVVEMRATTRLGNRAGVILERLGFTHIANQYSKNIRNCHVL